jgi:hypothetical protein
VNPPRVRWRNRGWWRKVVHQGLRFEERCSR